MMCVVQEAELERSRLQLQDVQQQRDTLLQQVRLTTRPLPLFKDPDYSAVTHHVHGQRHVLLLCSQSDGHRRSLGRLNRKLRQLSRSMCESDQLTVEQLKSTTEQLRALNHMVELLHTDSEQVHTHTHTLKNMKFVFLVPSSCENRTVDSGGRSTRIL